MKIQFDDRDRASVLRDLAGEDEEVRRLAVERVSALPVDEAIQALILEGADASRIKREAVKNGMRSLRQSALRRLSDGGTSYQEVVRVTAL